jgi:hypothetical protein
MNDCDFDLREVDECRQYEPDCEVRLRKPRCQFVGEPGTCINDPANCPMCAPEDDE